MEDGLTPEKAYAKSEFDKEVSKLLEQIYSVPPAERQFFLAKQIREIQSKKGTIFSERLDVLRAAVKRGNLLLELKAAQEILEMEKLRMKARPKRN